MKSEAFTFGLGYTDGMSWPRYIAELESIRTGIDLPRGLFPATFLVAVVGETMVGRISIRHQLDEFLAREGGHIGYGVLVEHRRRGYATEMLRQSVVVARSIEIDGILVTCDDTNVGSAAVIERCGGIFESVVQSTADGSLKRRYWIG